MGRAAMIAVLAVGLCAAPTSILGEELTSQQVRDSIEKGIAYLKLKQRADGGWGDWAIAGGGVAIQADSTRSAPSRCSTPGSPPAIR